LEQKRFETGMDPTALWSQWYETGTKMWSDMMRGSQESSMDPYGLYRQWFNGLRQMQEQMSGLASGTANGGAGNSQDLWQRWFEVTAESWRKSAELGQNMVDIAPRWMQMLEEARTNLMAADGPPADPLQFATQWYNATNGPFSDFVGDVIEREEFLEPSSQFLQNYASFYKVYKRNSEEYLKNLQIPVRSDITRVAELVVNLEDKVDNIEEMLEDLGDAGAAAAAIEAPETASAESVQALEGRLDSVENKLDRLLAAFETIAQNSNASPEVQPETPASAASNGSATLEVEATDAARRKAREMDVDLATVNGTGTDGQVTVDDVRKKGDS